MRFIVSIELPHEPFNSYVREGVVGEKRSGVIEETAPETIYFTDEEGMRGALAVYLADGASKLPALIEPWFLTFEASCRIRVAMTPDDVASADMAALGQRWG